MASIIVRFLLIFGSLCTIDFVKCVICREEKRTSLMFMLLSIAGIVIIL